MEVAGENSSIITRLKAKNNRQGKKLLGIPYLIVKSQGTEPLKTPLLAHFITSPVGYGHFDKRKEKASPNKLTLEETELLNSENEHASCSIFGGSIGSSTIVQNSW